MEKHPICIPKTLRFCEKLISFKYNPKQHHYNCKKINLEEIRLQGISNVGFFNLLRVFNKLPIPKNVYGFEGAYESWIHNLKKKKKLKKYTNRKYPLGTIFFIKDKMMVMNFSKQNIIYCRKDIGVIVERKKDFLPNFLITNICLPRDWILT